MTVLYPPEPQHVGDECKPIKGRFEFQPDESGNVTELAFNLDWFLELNKRVVDKQIENVAMKRDVDFGIENVTDFVAWPCKDLVDACISFAWFPDTDNSKYRRAVEDA